MTLFKDDDRAKITAKSKLSSIISELSEIESNNALEFVDWCLEKSKYHRKHNQKDKFPKLPNKMERGDIISVNFGINVGDEFSDIGVNNHFAIYWAQNGFQIVVIPISAEERQINKNPFAINIGKIPGLPKDKDSYVKLDMIKSISIRRIRRIHGAKDGKISLNKVKPEVISDIQKKIHSKF